MIGLIFAAALLQTEAQCYAADAAPPSGCPAWESLLTANGAELSVDRTTLRRDGDRFEIRFRVVFDEVQSDGTRTGVGVYRYDCAARTSVRVEVSNYRANGSLVSARAGTGQASPSPVPPRTPHELMLTEFCPRQG